MGKIINLELLTLPNIVAIWLIVWIIQAVLSPFFRRVLDGEPG